MLVLSTYAFCFFLFGLAQTGLSVKIEVTTHYLDGVMPSGFNIRCVPEQLADWSKVIVLLKVSRDDGKTIATIQGNDVIYYDRLLNSSVKAEGHIDRDVSKTFFSVTVNGAVQEDTGLYTCGMIYIDDVGHLKDASASHKVTIYDQDVRDVLRHFVQKLTLLEDLVKYHQDKYSVLESAMETREDELKEIINNSTAVVESKLSLMDQEVNNLRFKLQRQEQEIVDVVKNNSFVNAFSYSYSKDDDVLAGETLKFKEPLLGIGKNYDPTTGVFTCPRAGLYVFHLVAMDDNEVKVDLQVNDETMITLLIRDEDEGWDQSTATSVVSLKAGDTVKPVVVSISLGSILYHAGRFSTFSGYCLKPF